MKLDSKQPAWMELDNGLRLNAFLNLVTDLCSISESAQKVMELTRREDGHIIPVIDAVMKDPVLATEVLRIANSPAYGQRRAVTDLRRAVVIIGMQELHNLAAAMAMMAAFSSSEEIFSTLRSTSVLSASLSRLIAKFLGGVDEFKAFLAGLLCEIGAMACLSVDKIGYKAIWRESKGNAEERARLECERYTVPSEQIGAITLARFNLPEEVATAVQGDRHADDLITRITCFSRLAAPIIINAIKDEDGAAFHCGLPVLSADCGLTAIPENDLANICMKAARTAELGLSGKLAFVEEDPKNPDLSS